MAKKYLSKLTVGSNQYDIKDAKAWADIEDIRSSITGAMHWRGYTTTALEDGSTTNPIIIDGESYTAVAGDVVAVVATQAGDADLEFVFSGTKWQEYGSTGSLKALAFKDSASGSITCAGTNAASAVTFTGSSDGDFVTGYNDDAVAPSFSEGTFTPASFDSGFYTVGSTPSFTEGSFNAGTLPTFQEGSFTPASLANGFYNEGQSPTFTEGSFDAGTLPSFTEGQFTPASIQSGFVTAGIAATYSHSGFSGGSLGAATSGSFTTEGVVTSVDEANETLIFTDASTSSAVTAQGTFTPAVYGTDTFNGGTPTVVDTTKFNGGSKAADTFSAGTLPSKNADSFNSGSVTTLDLTKFDGGSKAADTFTQGTLPSKNADTFNAGTVTTLDLTKFDGGSKASDTFNAGSAATLATSKAVTNIGTGTAAAQVFTGATVSVTVS